MSRDLAFEAEARALREKLNGFISPDAYKNHTLSMVAVPIIQAELSRYAIGEVCRIRDIIGEGHKYCWRFSVPLGAWLLSTHPKSPANNPDDFAVRIIEPTERPKP